MNKFDSAYRGVLMDCLGAVPELNARTGKAVHARAGVTFRTDLETDGFPLLSIRKMPWSFVPEVMWMLSGSKSTEWLSSHTKIWDSFTEPDGTVATAYGNRWRHSFGVDQLDITLRKLSEDPSDRHAVVSIWDAREDLTIRRKNVPCPVMFTLNVIGGRLNLHLVIRSNDMMLGNPTDVAGFALLQCMLAQRLKLRRGILTVSISNAHVYGDQVPFAEELLRRDSETARVDLDLPQNSYARACGLDHELVGEIKSAFSGYKPAEALKGIPIAL